jgi:hypothetical protein
MEYKVKEFCKLISEFALEYKTVRDRLLQQQEKRANHRERHKTRGKMITEVSLKHQHRKVPGLEENVKKRIFTEKNSTTYDSLFILLSRPGVLVLILMF